MANMAGRFYTLLQALNNRVIDQLLKEYDDPISKLIELVVQSDSTGATRAAKASWLVASIGSLYGDRDELISALTETRKKVRRSNIPQETELRLIITAALRLVEYDEKLFERLTNLVVPSA